MVQTTPLTGPNSAEARAPRSALEVTRTTTDEASARVGLNGLEQALKRAAAHCARQGAQFTRLRKAVFQQLHESPEGLKAYAILEQMRVHFPSSTPATVYRALEFLIAQGLAHRLPGHNLFTACRMDHTAMHLCLFLVCPSCKSVTEVKDDELTHTLERCLHRAGYCLENGGVELSAYCPDCQVPTGR